MCMCPFLYKNMDYKLLAKYCTQCITENKSILQVVLVPDQRFGSGTEAILPVVLVPDQTFGSGTEAILPVTILLFCQAAVLRSQCLHTAP